MFQYAMLMERCLESYNEC